MKGFKFDTQKLHHLNDPERLKDIPPDYILEKLNIRKLGILVDIGAGTGFFSIQFIRMPGVEKVHALDISDEMIEYMQENIQPEHPEIIPRKISEAEINIENSTADIVIMINLHHEFHYSLKMLGEVYRILKPGRKTAIVDWSHKETEHGPPLEIRYKTGQITEQLNQTSFTEINVFNDLPKHYLIIAEKEPES